MTGFFLLALLAGLCFASPAGADDRVDRLPEDHKTWIEEEVIYIITDQEREAFLTLETVDERNRFIEAFWRKRDPNRTTVENEFKIEHYRRIDYANSHLGRETYLPGWKTDRGRYYIILGEPKDLQRYDGFGQIVSIESWFYQGDPELGVPAFFYLLFFKRNNFGEFRLYSPNLDGPQALLTGALSEPGSSNALAVQELGDISPELATASLSYDTAEPPDLISFSPSMSSELMVSRIEDSPKRRIRTDYADAALRYGNRVSADYTFNYIPSRSAFAVLVDPSDTALVQFSIEIDPEDFSTESDEDQTKFYTTLDLTVEARTPDGVLVVANDSEVYIELSPSRMQQVQSRPFAYQDQFPLVPGDYAVSVILRNRVLRRYTVAEAEIHVPDFGADKPELSDVILAYGVETADGGSDQGSVRTFQVGELLVQPAAGDVFAIGDTMHLVTQAFGASTEHKVELALASGDRVHQSVTSPVHANGLVEDQLVLSDLVGGTYELRARLVSPEGNTESERSRSLTVSPRSEVARPGFVYRRGFDSRGPGVLSAIEGEQLVKLGRFEDARIALEEAIAANSRHVPARIMLATLYLRTGNADETLELLAPVEEVLPNQYEVVSGIGLARYVKGEYPTAVDYLARAMTLRPPDALVLNALADAYERIGEPTKARETYERSLQVDPEQAEVRRRLETLPPG